MGRIVVGVDDSTQARRALAWALDEARLRGATLEILHAYSPATSYPPYAAAGAEAGAIPPPEAADAWEQEARTHAERVIDAVLGDVGGDLQTVRVERRVAPGRAAHVLLDRVKRANDIDLLVVGSRGRGGFKGLLMGSVSQHCVQLSPLPVVVVPSPR